MSNRYATWEQLVRRYPAAAKASSDQDMSDAYIAPAEAEVDSRLASRYTVPFTTVPDLVRSLTIDVAYYKLTIRSDESKRLGEYLYGKDGDGGIFGAIRDGKVVVDASATPTPNAAWVDKEYHSRFGPDNPEDWQPDTDALSDAADERSDD